jgi:hypothetical protein
MTTKLQITKTIAVLILVLTAAGCSQSSKKVRTMPNNRVASAETKPIAIAQPIPTPFGGVGMLGKTSSDPPSLADIEPGRFMVWKNTTDKSVKLYYNDNGKMKAVTLK